MLFRLVRKGNLKRELGKRGRGNKFTYFPAITPKEVKWRALKQLSEQYFEGSLRTMMSELSDAIGTSGEPSLKSGAPRSARDVKLVPHE
jgi:predicted transcriptional regulator